MGEKVVLLLGAGASVADVSARPVKSRPPLDQRFFSISAAADPADWRPHNVRNYVRDTYGIDIFAPEHDSLEGAMARLYPDLFNSLYAKTALQSFRALLQLFTHRLAATTNTLPATQKRLLYRILSRLFAADTDPSDVTVITFNQDLQVEKTLELFSKAKHRESIAERIFSFPEMYSVPADYWERISGPTRSRRRADLFPRTGIREDCVRVLKLHGSLNWYSTHKSATPSRTAMFRVDRRLSLTRRKTIAQDMTLRRKASKVYTLPVIVPPVNHKSSVLHEALGPIWTLAEQRLVDADQLIVFGYSCPALDFESANLLTRAQRRRPDSSSVSVIDPNGAIAMRYIDLLDPKQLRYYASAQDFLD